MELEKKDYNDCNYITISSIEDSSQVVSWMAVWSITLLILLVNHIIKLIGVTIIGSECSGYLRNVSTKF